jgi:hypothetical protein
MRRRARRAGRLRGSRLLGRRWGVRGLAHLGYAGSLRVRSGAVSCALGFLIHVDVWSVSLRSQLLIDQSISKLCGADRAIFHLVVVRDRLWRACLAFALRGWLLDPSSLFFLSSLSSKLIAGSEVFLSKSQYFKNFGCSDARNRTPRRRPTIAGFLIHFHSSAWQRPSTAQNVASSIPSSRQIRLIRTYRLFVELGLDRSRWAGLDPSLTIGAAPLQ